MTVQTDQRALDELCVNTIRTLSMDAVQRANSGHPGTPMALAPVAYLLYTRVMEHSPTQPDWPGRDRFVLSCGHASMLLYSILHLTGYGILLEDLQNFRQLGSPAAGHPEYGHAPGIETTTGPLGQGISTAVGMALGERMLAARFDRDGHEIVDHRTYFIASDGDLEEGIASEASSIAGHLGLGRLIGFYDDNHISIEGDTALAFDEDVGKRFEAYGWNVIHVNDANDIAALTAAFDTFRATNDKPTFIVVHSIIGWGSPRAGSEKAHGEPLGEENIRLTKQAYGWPEDAKFLVPDGVAEAFKGAMTERGVPLREAWQATFAKYHDEFPELAAELDDLFASKLPKGWEAALPTFDADAKGIASRDSSGKVLNALVKQVPWLVGGAADLAPSTKTDIKGAPSFEADNYGGSNFHFGVREHGMGGVVNGMALSYLRAYGSTFFVFTDYMRAPIRLSAIMELGVVWVFTHDSIGVGEDGPTHQPIEHLAMLRATPGLDTIRPGDANEVSVAWKAALEAGNNPTALVLSRQALPTIDRAKFASAEGLLKGGYVIADSDGEPELILIATGSELSLAIAAYEKLIEQGVAARVVSLPSWHRYEMQDAAYKESVLPKGVRARIAIEQAGEIGWDRYVGLDGATITMSTFGASAPLAKLQDKYGFTVDNVLKVSRALLGKDA